VITRAGTWDEVCRRLGHLIGSRTRAVQSRVVTRRAVTCLVAPPLLATGVLLAHRLAYLVVRPPAEDVHGYLEHAPQVLFIAGLLGLFALGSARQPARPTPPPFLAIAAATFALQEHVERFAHGGHWPFLLSSPVFLVGLVLQVPFALGVWLVTRWLLAAPGGGRRSRRRWLALVPAPAHAGATLLLARATVARVRARDPPADD
jgi:hypothetical protein